MARLLVKFTRNADGITGIDVKTEGAPGQSCLLATQALMAANPDWGYAPTEEMYEEASYEEAQLQVNN